MALAASVAAGVAAGLPCPAGLTAGRLIGVALAVGVAAAVGLSGGDRRRRLVWGLSAAAAGFLAATMPAEPSADREESPASIVGVVTASPRREAVPHTRTVSGRSGDYTRVPLLVEHGPAWLEGRELEAVVDGHVPTLSAGDRVRAEGVLGLVEPAGNPGRAAGERRWRLSVARPDAIAVVDARPPWRRRVRGGVAATLRSRLRFPRSAVAEALVLGTRDRVPESLTRAFGRTGVGHLLSISGTHVGIVAGLALLIVSRVTGSAAARALAVLACVLAFAWLTETRTSVVRATILAAAAAAGVLAGRRLEPLAVLSVALLAVLSAEPAELLEPGTQLSFAAVLAILLANRAGLFDRLTPWRLSKHPDERWAARSGRWAWQTVLLSFVVWAAVTPLIWLHFREVTFWAPLLTVAMLPVVAATMATLLPLTALDLWWPMPDGAWAVPSGLIAAMSASVEAVSGWLGSGVTVRTPPSWAVAAAYAALLAAGLARSRRTERWAVRGLLVGGACLAGASVWPASRPALRVTTLSVGHGLCVVVQTGDGRTALYDVGSMGDSHATGDRVAAALRELGVDSVQTVFLSHADRDHYASLPPLLEEMAVGRVLVHPSFRADAPERVEELLSGLESRGVPVGYTAAGDRYRLGAARLDVLHPSPGDRFESDNEESLVLSVEAAGRRVLLTGDVEGRGLSWMLSLDPRPCDLLLAPHHGAVAGNTAELDAWATPKAVACSSGHERAGRLESVYRRAVVFQTRTDGAVIATVEGDGSMRVEGWKSKRRFRVP